MNELNLTNQDRSVMRWGGWSGVIGSVLLIAVMVFVGVFIGTEDPETLKAWVERFPDIHMARVVENGIYLSALLFMIPLFLGIFWSLRQTRLAPALFGSALGIVGLVSMIVSATPHVAHAPLSEIYHAAGTSSEIQESIAVMWQGTWGLFNAPLYVGFFIIPVGMILCGIAMFDSPVFGRGLRWLSIILGIAGFVAAVLQMVDPASFIGVFSYFSFIIFGFAAGLRLRRPQTTV